MFPQPEPQTVLNSTGRTPDVQSQAEKPPPVSHSLKKDQDDLDAKLEAATTLHVSVRIIRRQGGESGGNSPTPHPPPPDGQKCAPRSLPTAAGSQIFAKINVYVYVCFFYFYSRTTSRKTMSIGNSSGTSSTNSSRERQRRIVRAGLTRPIRTATRPTQSTTRRRTATTSTTAEGIGGGSRETTTQAAQGAGTDRGDGGDHSSCSL